ncbi:hypothetical protein EJB05_05044 [Eragrostis curvula]|uniref:Pescadillo homolog n=1 Tax=Eragrostis curvula TaxID=38414 RepID=A0A5J9WCB5_9POAL|nr:hypothetical protein EJB05_05044 [Eragrostis curvula]
MPKHYRPAGKKKEGNAAKYITRTKAVNYLQISLATFRKLCILKGVFPRQPKKKVEGNHKTYYHMKDIAFLLHDPLIEKFSSAYLSAYCLVDANSMNSWIHTFQFERAVMLLTNASSMATKDSKVLYLRVVKVVLHVPTLLDTLVVFWLLVCFWEIKVHRKKVKKAVAKKNKDLAERLLNRPPTYKLDRLILERYPTFVDALRDLDDCLTMVHLFAALPAVDGERVEVKRIHNCRRLSHEWQAYISRTHSLRKTFISVKGIYYQAEVQGQKITWLTPHALQQVLTDDVDFNVMLTFLEFYETLLGFVNFKLYHSINVNYPPILDPRLEALAAELYALCRYMSGGSQAGPQADKNNETGPQADKNNEAGPRADESELRLAQLQHQLPTNEPGALMHLVEESTADDADDEETNQCKSLFKNLKFYLSREVPRESLLFIIPAFGGTVSWEGEGAPFNELDQDITHQIVDRPTQSHVFLSREYVQPQWIFDCVNARIVLPTEGYLVGRLPPPHLSPFVDNDAEGYIPEYAETIRRLQAAARNEVLPLPGIGDEDLDNSLVEAIIDRNESNEVAERKRKLDMLEKQYHDELKMECEGVTFSTLSNTRADNPPDAMDKDDTQSDHKEDANKQAEKDAADVYAPLMSRKRRGLYEAIKINKERRQDKIETLKKRKKNADSSASAKRR